MQEILDLISKHPNLLNINNKINRNDGYMFSLERDKIIVNNGK